MTARLLRELDVKGKAHAHVLQEDIYRYMEKNRDEQHGGSTVTGEWTGSAVRAVALDPRRVSFSRVGQLLELVTDNSC